MANMIPNEPRNFIPASAEGEMFEALKSLPGDYYVFHSVSLFYKPKGKKLTNDYIERECDFLIFHPQKGLLCIEAKNGDVQYEDGLWKYSSGVVMSHDGPYNQSSTYKHKLIDLVSDVMGDEIKRRCKFIHAVWFPAISRNELEQRCLPTEADINITLTKEALKDPQNYIEKIFDNVSFGGVSKTKLTTTEVNKLISQILAPEFKVFASKGFNLELHDMIFDRLQKEQNAILNFIEEQRTAVINGAAGTGKTVVALEKARRHADNGEKVLFMCYNRKLKDHLESTNSHVNIDFFTIDGFACKICGTRESDYGLLSNVLENYFFVGGFPYKHIIIDEGQDFGKENIEETSIIELLHDIITEDEEGTFYVFFDELQLIQSKTIPNYIKNADCKLTLYRNCRNTESIAKTSLKTINSCKVLNTDVKRRNLKMMEGALQGKAPNFRFVIESAEKCVDDAIEEYKKDNLSDADIVILTCSTIEKSSLSRLVENEKYKGKYTFTTCAKFKGLEARGIILVDVDRTVFFDETKSMAYYVGSSRAKLYLNVVLDMTDTDCRDVLENAINYEYKIKDPRKDLSNEFNARMIV